MKPMQVGILMAAAALAGGLFMRWESRPAPQPPVPAAQSVAPTPVAPAPVASELAEASKPPESLPSPVGTIEEQPRKRAVAEPKHQPARSATQANRTAPKSEVAANHVPAVQPQAPEASQPASVVKPAAPQAEPTTPSVPLPVLPPPPPPPRKVTLLAGTLLPVRIVESLSSDRNQPGDTFTATLDGPVIVDGFVIAERGARLEGRVVQSQRAGRVQGVSDLAIALTQLRTSDGQRVRIETEPFEKHGPTSHAKDAAKVGAGAAIGAAIGASAGGGKGAGIGAAVGGAAGTGGVLATRGDPAVLPAETKISFRLLNAVTLTERQSAER